MYKRVRSAKQRQAMVAKEAEALLSRRAKLAHELRTLEARCDEKLAEAQQESERVAARLQEEEEKATQLEATGRRRAPRAAGVADEHMMPDRDRLQVLDEQRHSLRATVQIGREYVAWLEAQLAACAAEAGGAQGAPATPRRGEQSKSRGGPPRVPSPQPLPAAKPPPPPAHAPAPAQVQAGAQSRAAAAEVQGAVQGAVPGRRTELDGPTPRSNVPSSHGQHAQGGQHAHAKGAAGQHAAAGPSKKKAPALPDLLGGAGGAAASDARFAAFGGDQEVLKSVTRAMSGNIVQVVKFDSGMRDELRCRSCKNMLREPMVNEEGATLCRGCLPADAIAVPNYIIETLAGRQDYKNTTRDPGVTTN